MISVWNNQFPNGNRLEPRTYKILMTFQILVWAVSSPSKATGHNTSSPSLVYRTVSTN